MPTQKELAEQAMVFLSEGDFESLHDLMVVAQQAGFYDLSKHIAFVIETVTEEGNGL